MAVYTISDLHLPLGVNKPMDIFGAAWSNYVNRLAENWHKTVTPADTVVLGGDFSWATYLEQSVADFEFLHSLPGRKLLLKGNHDYWWTTKSKLDQFLAEHGFNDIEFLHNNSYIVENISICGSRGWGLPEIAKTAEDVKIYERELGRVKMSIDDARKKSDNEIVVFLHFPPLLRDMRTNPMTALLTKENIKRCYFGHLHKSGSKNVFEGLYGGVEYKLCACDYLNFMPIRVNGD